jgi:hypothetical protein
MDEQYMQVEDTNDMPPLSDSFVSKVKEQREEVKRKKQMGKP